MSFYNTPKGKEGRLFVTLLNEDLQGAQERRWNSECLIVFIGTVLDKIPGVNRSNDIRGRILSIMDHWTDVLIVAFIEDTCGTGKDRN